MQFKNSIGQAETKALLQQMVLAARVPHAQLFLGAEGSGKLALALALAQFIVCENKLDKDACGQCKACSKAEKLIHPDIHFSFPTIGSKVRSDQFLPQWRNALLESPYISYNDWLQQIGAENKQGNINKEECLNIIQKMSLRPFESPYKVLIMWLPEYLGKEGNRLLKLIEEPPENTFFILVAEKQELILNTILSRCQLVKIRSLQDEEIIEGLKLQKGLTEEAAQSIAHLADGNFHEALSITAQNENENAELFLDWMRKCYKGNSVELVKWVDKFATLGRERQKYFIQYALHFMREYTILRMTGNTNIRLLEKELKTAKNLVKVIGFQQIELITNLFNDCSYYIERNANPKVLFLDTSIQMHKILRNKVPKKLKTV